MPAGAEKPAAAAVACSCWNIKTETIILCAGTKVWFVEIRSYGTQLISE